MKKVIFGLACMAALMTSCKKETKIEVNEATEAVGDDMGEAMDTAAVKIDAAVDSTKVKAGETLEKAGENMNEAGENMQESGKK